ncbi:MAG: hypothetical protein H7Y17_09360 [Chlorobia bacterium]|nr:hypothetical protein [Fimbriimonadaceae bacterium]
MRKLLTLCLIAVAVPSLFAQEDMSAQPSKASQKYAEFRHQDVEPTYGLAKVKAMVKRLKEDKDMNRYLPDKDYAALSFEEKFTFAMIHGEDFSQNCDAMPAIMDEHKKIFSFFPSAFDDEVAWSQRQRDFLKGNRAKVIALIKDTILTKKRVGSNLKSAILELNAVETIPVLVTTYNRDRKDHDILTLMMVLMKENKFPAFLKSSTYRRLYGDEDNYMSFVMATPAIQRETINWATSLYKSKRLR